ncbi:hypothetical protein EO087_10845 [Dyella sp. M7H15-1]|uniref:DUF6708 domain-containing protein n=1 Tax=Dyella sp. M7H15-1 TaxID=2501295 RepID=UPI001004F77B|nr:DUF6708 domain-containing protein [Dyella sp. M7H15-1]QAU24426.1 hypothetical protein EO087_10845 [Dyella sp. M7H15-1]
MYTGWLQPFRRKGPLLQEERDTALSRKQEPDIEPSQRMGLIRINSTYLDWIDRRYLFRGNFPIFLGTSIGVCFVVLFVFLIIFVATEYEGYIDLIGLTSFFLVSIFPIFKLVLLKEYFTYTHYPIRFNRKTRMVHVFRHNGPGGVLSVPWDKVFFHIGQGTTRKDLIDIRGEVLDGDIVKDTFALGHAVPKTSRALLEMWEFIRRYMDEGSEAVGQDPLDRYVELSVTPTWKNCWLIMRNYYAAGVPAPLQVLVWPFVLLYTLTRWVVLHTCRKPIFPPEIEATCKVEPNDPNVWPIPPSSGEFAATIPGVLKRAEARATRNRQMEQKKASNLP